jgi:alpha-1,2-mannosyltransferase
VQGGGFYGLGNYDDGVYFAAAVALVHGELPYRDFLLLHPPGIVLALAPFAALSRLLDEPTGLALARAAWILLGALSAVLVVRILTPVGRFAAVLGGLCYAVFYPAVYVESTTQLQGLANTLLLGAMLLLTAGRTVPARGARAVLVAGALVGAATTVKIWCLVALLLVVVWLVLGGRIRQAGVLLAGAAASIVVVCLPFFAGAPAAMWRLVVTAQLLRQVSSASPGLRLRDILGLHLYSQSTLARPLAVAAVAAFGLALVLAWRQTRTRLAVVLLVGLGGFLLLTPSWFQHYASLTASPAAVVLASGGNTLVRWAGRRRAALGAVTGLLIVAALVVYASPLRYASFGRPFPGQVFREAVAGMPGCIAADNQVALVQMDVLGRNLGRGCPFVADLGGYSYVLPRGSGKPFPRARDEVWQRHALAHLRSGEAVILTNYRAGDGLSRTTAAQVRQWPVVERAGGFRLRRPDR